MTELRLRLKIGWRNFRASWVRQVGAALSLLVIGAVLILPESIHRPLVVLMIPVSSWLAFRVMRDQRHQGKR